MLFMINCVCDTGQTGEVKTRDLLWLTLDQDLHISVIHQLQIIHKDFNHDCFTCDQVFEATAWMLRDWFQNDRSY